MFFKKIFLLLVSLLALPALAQSDLGLWTGLTFEKEFGKRFSLDAGVDFRAAENITRESRWAASLGAGYKVNKHLKLGAGYIFITDRNPWEYKVNYNDEGEMKGYNVDHAYWRNKHRAFFEATGKVKAGRFSFSLRERYQFTHFVADSTERDRYRGVVTSDYPGKQYNGYAYSETVMDHKGSKNRHYLRSRLKVEYDIRKCPLTPIVSYEVYNNLSEGFDLDKSRLSAGLEWKVTKKVNISAAYLFQTGADDDSDGDEHIIDIGFKFEL